MPWLLLFYSLSNGLSDPFNEGNIQPLALDKGEVRYGTTDGLRVGLGESRELITGGLTSLVSPELMLSQTVFEGHGVAVSVQGGLGLPAFGLRLAQGMWFPSDVEIPLGALVGAAGVSAGTTRPGVVSIAGTVHVRAALPQDTGMLIMDHPWLDSNLAPLTEGFGLTTRARVAWYPSDGWEVSADGKIQWVGGPDLAGRLLVHRVSSEHLAMGLGVSGAREVHTYGVGMSAAPILEVSKRW